MDSTTQWNSCKLPKPTTFLLVASVRISHPQQFRYILFNLHRELDVQVSNLRSALLWHAKCASQFLSGAGNMDRKGSWFVCVALSGPHFSWLPRQGPGSHWDGHSTETEQKSWPMGLALVMLLSCCLCFKKNISLQREMGALKKKKKATYFKRHKLLHTVF